MKTLILIRHSKSSWEFSELEDIERPLNERGNNDAPMMGKVLKNLEMIPDMIISSPAVRAMSTARLMAKELNYSEALIVTEPNLYFASKSKMFEVIHSIDEKFNTVFVVSHNPGVTELANSLLNSSIDDMPTSCVLGIQFNCNAWSDVKKGKGKKIFLEIAKKHRKKSEKREEQVL